MRKIIMKGLFTKLFVVSILFSVNGFASPNSVYRLLMFGGKKIPKTQGDRIRSLLEKNPYLVDLIGDGNVDIAFAGIRAWFNNESALQNYLIWFSRHKGVQETSYVFLRLWDLGNFKNEIFYLVTKEHLIDNDRLFWKWLEMAQSRKSLRMIIMRNRYFSLGLRSDSVTVADKKLRQFVDNSIRNVKDESASILSGSQLQKKLIEDPFVEMIIRLSFESEYLRYFVEEIMEDVLNNPHRV